MARYTGFLCGDCLEGFAKLDGDCEDCPGTNYAMLCIAFVTNLFMALFMLFKSKKSTISRDEIGDIWDKVDILNDGSLKKEKLAKVMELLGELNEIDDDVEDNKANNHKLEERNKMLDNEHKKMYHHVYPEKKKKKKGEIEDAVPADFGVPRSVFLLVKEAASPSAAMGTAIFYIQTLGLIAKDNQNFMTKMSKALNLHPEENAKQCVTPMDTLERYYVMNITFTILTLLVGLPLMVPVWNVLTDKVKLFRKVLGKKIHRIQMQRALLNTYLFVYMPVVQSSIQMFLCVDTCHEDDGGHCDPVMEIDYGISCTSPEYATGITIAFFALGIMCFAVPWLLLYCAYHAVNERKISLSLKMSEIENWFNEIDVDKSGTLDISEIEALLLKMGRRHLSKKTMQKVMVEMTTVGKKRGSRGLGRAFSGHKVLAILHLGTSSPTHEQEPEDKEVHVVSKLQFTRWFELHIENMACTSYDVVIGTTHYHSYWWFAQVLYLKTLIAVLFSFGRASDFEWHVWVHLVLGIHTAELVLRAPYRSHIDMKVELLAILCLALVVHVASLYNPGEVSHGR
jgi:hypothetical protein